MNGNKVVTANFTHDEQLPKDLIINQGVLREDFEALDGWSVSGSASGYLAEIDTTNYRIETNSIRLTTPSGGNVIVAKSVNWDLSAPAEQGNFRLWVYVYGTSEPAGFQIHLSNDAGFQNYYVAWYGSGIRFRNRPGVEPHQPAQIRLDSGGRLIVDEFHHGHKIPVRRNNCGLLLAGWAL